MSAELVGTYSLMAARGTGMGTSGPSALPCPRCAGCPFRKRSSHNANRSGRPSSTVTGEPLLLGYAAES